MIKTIPCTLSAEQYEAMRDKVLKMNTNIQDFVYDEMLNHKTAYSAGSGLRNTSFVPTDSNWYVNRPVITPDGTLMNCECIEPAGLSQHDILYVHGAAFQRRVNDINLKTADRLCAMTNGTVYVPDYRIGIDYTYEQMVSDVVACYEELLAKRNRDTQRITLLADSSGCVTAMQAVRRMLQLGLPTPGKIVLWSPQLDAHTDMTKVIAGRIKDIAFQTNTLFSSSQKVYTEHTCAGLPKEEVFPIYGDYTNMVGTEVLISVADDEFLFEDSVQFYAKIKDICPCTLEVYEKMYHNFQTYYSICEMSKTAWANAVEFIIKR